MIRKALRTILGRLGPKPIDGRYLQASSVAPFDLPDLLTAPRARNEAVIRNLCFNAYLGNATALCRVLGRYKMLVDTEDHGLSVHLIADGLWEMEHTEATMRLVKPGMKAVDIGANLGYFSLLLADIVGPNGSVHAFEPNPALAARLATSIEINGFADRTTVHTVALSDRAGEREFVIPVNQPKNGRLLGGRMVPSGEGLVSLQRFDAIAALADADYVKIDVEGAEQAVWRGMAGLISTGRPLTVVLEFTSGRYANAGKFLDAILSGGFSLDVIEPIHGITPISREDLLARPPSVDQLIVLRR